ncbi:exonuclease [Aureococcus anophagefferens]|nr:exonuclease [Aureococcus anophagefferens]
MSAPQHSWQARCAAKRDEIERDTRMLDERKKNRIERLYRELEATNEALVPVEATTARAEGDRDRVVDGKLDLRDRMMRELVIPRSVEQCLETRSLRTLVLRGNRLRVLDARTLAPLVSLVSLDVSRNELERLGPTGAVTVHSDDAARYAAHPSLRRISALPPSSGTAPAVGGFPPGLETLCAAYNRIARLSFGPGGAPRLLRVSVAHNCVKFVAKDVDKAPLLEELDLRDNHLPTAQLRHLAPLRRVKRLLLAGNPLSDDRRHSHGLPAHLRGALNAPRLLRAPPVPSRPPPETLRPDPRGARRRAAAADDDDDDVSMPPAPVDDERFRSRAVAAAAGRRRPLRVPPAAKFLRAEADAPGNGDASKRSESPTSTVRKPTLRERLQKTAAAESASSEEEEEESEEESEDDDDDESSGSGTVYSEDGPDWVEGWDSNHKHVYYFNVQTEETTWTRPFGEEIRPMSAKDAALRTRDLLKSTNYAGPRSRWGRTPSGSEASESVAGSPRRS